MSTPSLSENPTMSEDLKRILDQTSELHRDLNNSRVLVTGGTGFFGRWLLESWVDATNALGLDRLAVVVCRDPKEFQVRVPHLADHRSVQLVRGDVLGRSPVSGAFDACIHAATAASLALSLAHPKVMFDTVVTGTSNVLDWLEPSGQVPVLFTSSGAVYGSQAPDLSGVSETSMTGPNTLAVTSVYAEAKRAAEMLCTIAGERGLDVKIARCFAFVGPYLPIDAHYAIGNFIRDALVGGPIEIKGDGTPVRSYLYASDLVVWLWTILLRGQRLRPYNVGGEVAIDLRALAEIVGAEAGVTVEVKGAVVPGAVAARYVPDVGRAVSELGLGVTVPLVEAIRRTISWHRAERSR